MNLCGLCLLIFVVIPVCFTSFLATFFIEAALSLFLFRFSWISTVCCVASLPLDLRTLLFYLLVPFSSASLCWRCWSSSMGSLSSSSLLASFTALAKHNYGPLWMSVPLVAFIGELHSSDDSVLQLIRGFI